MTRAMALEEGSDSVEVTHKGLVLPVVTRILVGALAKPRGQRRGVV